MKVKKKTKYVHEGRYVAEVDVDLILTEDEWAPYLSVEDAERLDEVRKALQKEDFESASRHGRVFRLEPVKEP
ncbi:MAG: hypothetical protein EA363_09415 [Balneolaceae bacterium]|nr:MAG: hypothetical protein EA363_09415 [Balneolaceae bacterium]